MPMRILLVGAVVFLAAWFTVLKPKPAEVAADHHLDDPAGHRCRQGRRRGQGRRRSDDRDARRPTPTPLRRRRPRPRPRLRPPRPSRSRPRRWPSFPRTSPRALEARKVLVLGVFADRPSRGARCPTTTATCATPCARPTATTATSSSRTSASQNLSTYGPLVNDLHVNQSPAIVVIDAQPQGPRADRLRRPDLDQPGDRRRPRRERRAGHQGRLPAPVQRHLRPVQPPHRALVVPDPGRQEGDGRLARPRAGHRPQLPPRDRPHRGPGQVACDARPAGSRRWTRPRPSCWPRRRPSSRAASPISWSRSTSSRSATRAATALDRRFNAAGVTGCAAEPPGLDSSGRGPRTIRRASRRAQWARRCAFRGA